MAANVEVSTPLQKLLSKKLSATPSPMKKWSKMQQISPRKSFGSQRNDVPSHPKLHGKRRYTIAGTDSKSTGISFKRRKTTMVPPTKFLLGGNINDPLNLGSLADEAINKSLNEVTPYSSPVPTPKHRHQVEVLIPPNINDPLNLNAGDDAELNLISPKMKKRKNRKRKKNLSGELHIEIPSEDKSGEDELLKTEKSTEEETTTVETNVTTTVTDNRSQADQPKEKKQKKTEDKTVSPVTPHTGQKKRANERSEDKIVSPVIPQTVAKKRNSAKSTKVEEEQQREKETTTKTDHPPKHFGSRKSSWQQKKQHNTSQESKPKFRSKDAHFQYGNYNRYYGYRNPTGEDDPRLKCMKREWFEGKDVLDVGCNVGFVTLEIARNHCPRKIIGIDIDLNLVRVAKKNIRHYMTEDINSSNKFPISLPLCHGPVAAASFKTAEEEEEPSFPNNVFFIQGNYVLENEDMLEYQTPEYDTILCLSLTKWIHLNWGDDGLKKMFKRIYAQLRPGGRLILEPQAWQSYNKKKKVTETIYNNYNQIKFRPEQFTEYLLSKEVGFSKCEVIDTPFNSSKGFRRPLQLFTKNDGTTPQWETPPPSSSSSRDVAASKDNNGGRSKSSTPESKRTG